MTFKKLKFLKIDNLLQGNSKIVSFIFLSYNILK